MTLRLERAGLRIGARHLVYLLRRHRGGIGLP